MLTGALCAVQFHGITRPTGMRASLRQSSR
jgi:hypothetical protein